MIRYYKKEYPTGTIVIGKFDDECRIDDTDDDYLAEVYSIDTDAGYLRLEGCKDIINKDEFDSVQWVDEKYYSQFGSVFARCCNNVRDYLMP